MQNRRAFHKFHAEAASTVRGQKSWDVTMRDCYKKFWKAALVAKFGEALPQFQLKETASRKASDEAKPSAKPVELLWNPIDKLGFKLIFTAHTRQDHFWAFCEWSETAKAKATGESGPRFAENAWDRAYGYVRFQTLSGQIDQRETYVQSWDFWTPTSEFGDTRESQAAWKAEFMADELRQIGDEEARQRVEVAVDKSTVDIKRCAMPWFEKKLEWYMQNKASVS